MAYAMNAIDWYRGNRPGMIGFGSFAAWDGPDTLPPGGTLRDGDCMVSNNRYFAACLSGGNLYIHRRNDPALSLVKVIGGSGLPPPRPPPAPPPPSWSDASGDRRRECEKTPGRS